MTTRFARLFALVCCVSLLAAAGCRKPVYFPAAGDDQAARSIQAAGAYDADHDGRLDFFTFANDAGRIDRIGFDVTGDQKPDQLFNLDAIPFNQCRHLVLILDGFGYDVVSKYYQEGGLRLFHPPSRVIAPYPTMTDLCVQDLIGGMACRACEARYFDRAANRLVGGSGDYLGGANEPYNRLLQYRAESLWDVIGYIDPWAAFGKEVNDAKRVFDRAETKEMLAYFVSSAGVSVRIGAEGQVRCLKRIDQMVNQVIWETHGLTKVTLTSDHGHSYTPGKRVDFEGYLRKKGWRLADSLRKERDVVYVQFGLVTFADFATFQPARLAEDLVGLPGVEITSYADGGDVVVLSDDGGQARIGRAGDRYSYQAVKGDPLKLAGILSKMDAAGGFYDADELLAATFDHVYPAPLERLWRAHFGLVRNPPDVLVSLKNDCYSGSASFAGSVTIVSTHGGLNRANSTTFIMSTAGELPELLRSRDVPQAMKALTGSEWPSGK